MTKIFSSATKIAFLLLILSASIGFFRELITGEQFMSLVMVAALAYWKTNQTAQPQ
jgi:hypothetical protein